MTKIPEFETIAKAHGHTCPGISLGYKIAIAAATWAGDEDDIKILAHTTRCPLDAIKITFDTKNHPERLLIDDTNTVKFVMTKPNGDKLYIDELPGTKITSDELKALKKKAEAGNASDADLARINEIKEEHYQIMKALPSEKLFTVREDKA